MGEDKSYRGAASQFFVAGELCRRRLVAVVTLGNCPNTDVLVSNQAGTHFAHVQVKTFRPGVDKGVSVGIKAECDYGPKFFWVLAGIPEPSSDAKPEYFVVPSADMAQLVAENHQLWRTTKGKRGQTRSQDTTLRIVGIPPARMSETKKSIDQYRKRWDLIGDCCQGNLPQSKNSEPI